MINFKRSDTYDISMEQALLEKSLERAGLTRNESIVYLTLLRLGTSKVSQILQGSNINSGKIYEILESLKLKGLISESIINNIRHFTSATPLHILEYLEKKKREFKKNEDAIKSFIPEMEKLREVTPKFSKAITYTGFKGMKTAVDEAFTTLHAGDEILTMGITEMKDKKINKFWEIFTQKRILRKIKAKHIFSERGWYFKKFKNMKYTQSKVLEAFTPVAIDIFGKDKVLIHNYGKPELISCILIYDENTAISFTHFFNQLWKLAKS